VGAGLLLCGARRHCGRYVAGAVGLADLLGCRTPGIVGALCGPRGRDGDMQLPARYAGLDHYLSRWEALQGRKSRSHYAAHQAHIRQHVWPLLAAAKRLILAFPLSTRPRQASFHPLFLHRERRLRYMRWPTQVSGSIFRRQRLCASRPAILTRPMLPMPPAKCCSACRRSGSLRAGRGDPGRRAAAAARQAAAFWRFCPCLCVRRVRESVVVVSLSTQRASHSWAVAPARPQRYINR